MLNRRMPNGMYGGVRGRLNPPYSIAVPEKHFLLIREHSPEKFYGDYDAEFVKEMLDEELSSAESMMDSVVETTDDYVEEIVHARTR